MLAGIVMRQLPKTLSLGSLVKNPSMMSVLVLAEQGMGLKELRQLVQTPAATIPLQPLFTYTIDCETCKEERAKLRLDYEDEKQQGAAALRQVQALKDAKLSFWSRHQKGHSWSDGSAVQS